MTAGRVPWHHGPMLAWDLETTGAEPETARIVTSTIVELYDGVVRTREWLVDPGVEIPEGATAVHGVTTERAQAEGVDAATAVAEIRDELLAWQERGLPVVTFNGGYDATVLDRELRRHHGEELGPFAPMVDAHVIDKAVHPYRKGKRTLTSVCEHYKVRIDGAHDATADALAAARVAWRIAETYPDRVQIDLAELHAAQTQWRAEQCASLAKYFARQGKTEDVRGEWPVLPVRSPVPV